MTGLAVHKLQTLTGHSNPVYSLEGGATPSLFYSGAGDGMVVQWDLSKPNEGFRIAHLPNSVYALHYVAHRNVLVAGHNYDGIHVIDPGERRELSSLKMTGAAIFDIQSVGDNLLVASGDGSFTVVDIESMTIKIRHQHTDHN